MHLLLVVRISFVGFVFVVDKSFVSKAPVLLTSVKRLLLELPAFQSQSLNSSYRKFLLKRLS